jgi:hypothetical protein
VNLTPVAEAVASQRPARCVILQNIMAPHEAKVFEVPAGTVVGTLDPKGRFPAICRLDGQWTLRKDWNRPLLPGQIAEFYEYPQGGGDGGGSNVGRAILMIAALYLSIQFGQWYAAQGITGALGSQAVGTAIAQLVLTTVVNALVPVNSNSSVTGTSNSDSSSYSANLSGNQARLEQAIPVLYGRNKTFPDFASQPYSKYENDDQYFYALLCLGQGSYTIESMFIDDTNLLNFAEVTRVVLPPGTPPTLVSPVVVSAPEVTNNPLTEGRYIGPFVACRPQDTVVSLGIDISFSRGLATYDSAGVPGNKTVAWKVEYRKVDDFGAGLTPWTVLANESLTAAQTKPLRRSYEYTLPAACRPQVRLVRTTPFDDNSRVANTIEWMAMRATLSAPAPLSTSATHIEIKMRATDQLSGLTQRRIGVISRRKLRTWTGSAWTVEVETRNAAWALADKWTNQTYGDKYPDERCDLRGLLALATKADARQDRFDAVFDTTYDSFQADQMIAQSVRSAVFRRGAVMTVTRDEKKDFPVTAFTSRNIDPGSVSIDYRFADENTPDGVIVEYWHNRTWDWREITCPAPGVTTPVRAQRIRLFGVTGPTHAQREGLYQAANTYWRRRFASFTTELEGMLPAFGSAVAFSPSLTGWGKSGDIVNYSVSSRTLVLSEPLTWVTGASHYLSVVQRDGSVSTPILVNPGSASNEVILASALVEDPSIDQADEDRTKYLFGVSQPYDKVLRVLGIRDSQEQDGRRKFSINGVIEDDRVHTVDNLLLPIDATVQDPVDSTADDGSGSGGALVAYLETAGYSAVVGTSYARLDVTLRNNGIGEVAINLDGVPSTSRMIGQWMLASPHPTTDTSQFEVFVEMLSGAPLAGSALGTWLNLGTDRSWYYEITSGGGDSFGTAHAKIREIATGIIQAEADWYVQARTFVGGGA